MGVKVGKKHLQTDKYNYVWSRDQGDGEYTGIKDRIKIDKDEGYEVLYFIQTLMNKHGLKSQGDVRNIEDALHSPDLSGEVMRDFLTAKVEEKVGL